MARAKILLLALLGISFLPLTPKVYAVSDIPYSHPINGADTCAPTGLETWGLTGNPNDTFFYGFGLVAKSQGEFSSDFTGSILTSISLYLCGYKNDSIADSNLVNIGIFNQADGSLRQSFGTVSFDSLPTCHLNQNGGGGNCSSVNPTLITVTGSYRMVDGHSPGGTDYIGVSFPTHSAVGHDVLMFCANNCSNTVVTHGGICDPYNAFPSCNAVQSVSAGSAMAATLLFTPRSLASTNFAAGINQASLLVGLVLILLIVWYMRTDKTIKESNYLLDAALGLAVFFVVLQALGAIIT